MANGTKKAFKPRRKKELISEISAAGGKISAEQLRNILREKNILLSYELEEIPHDENNSEIVDKDEKNKFLIRKTPSNTFQIFFLKKAGGRTYYEPHKREYLYKFREAIKDNTALDGKGRKRLEKDALRWYDEQEAQVIVPLAEHFARESMRTAFPASYIKILSAVPVERRVGILATSSPVALLGMSSPEKPPF